MNVRRPRRPSSGRLGQGAPCLRRLAARLRPPIHPPSLLPVQQRGRLRTHTERERHTRPCMACHGCLSHAVL